MKIDIERISDFNSELVKIKDDYEINLLNYDNCIKEIEKNWRSRKSFLFFEKKRVSYEKFKENVRQLSLLIDIYNYIIAKYSIIGKKIDIKLDSEEKILSYVDKVIEKVDLLYKRYEQLDYSYIDVSLREKLNVQKNKISSFLNMIIDLKSKIKEIFDYVKESENKISIKLSRINFTGISIESVKL